jgi:hypothetical protein
LPSPIHPVLEVLACLEKGQFLRCNLNLLSGFRVPSGVRLIFLNEKRIKAPDFNSISISQCAGYFIENQVYDRLSF